MLENIFEAVAGYLAQFGFWGVFAGMLVESACIPLPSEIVLPLGGFMAYRGHMTFWEAVMAGQAGGLAGSVIAYAAGLWGGRPLLERYGRWLLISAAELDQADRWFARRGELTVFLARLLPGVRTFISLPAGIAGMNFGRFLWYSFLGMLPWSWAFTYAGFKLGENWPSVRGYLHRFDLLIIGALAAGAGWFIWTRIAPRSGGG